ncbi:hypothetical protein KIN20_018914 [Parelaphostrongylus tenuis]|uniref:Uncharacterized protein n=1 Tax=Parelaphostrongylus tenuis TaxID=148309 RepID=A0AAD5MKM7_PARTN|nr:hypothetical protein KIN20_018914 [Parelaphostrongylus tenuis]
MTRIVIGLSYLPVVFFHLEKEVPRKRRDSKRTRQVHNPSTGASCACWCYDWTKGVNINELRNGTEVFQQCCPQSTDRVAMIPGAAANVIDAVEHIAYSLNSD